MGLWLDTSELLGGLLLNVRDVVRHGADFGIPELLRLLSDDCPKRK